MQIQNKLIITEDGSHTIFVPALDEHYHSVHGAVNESLHIYINSGLKYHTKKEINLLEVGFGTGLNAYLSLAVAIQQNINIQYFTIEKYPLPEAEYKALNYPSLIFPEYSPFFLQLHQLEWNKEQSICSEFSIKKIHADLKTIDYKYLPFFDLIYYDAFAPGKQPEMWTHEIFEKIARHTNPGGIFVTYCAKGSVRRMLDSLGFQMERLPGPAGKKEILRGIKHIEGSCLSQK